MLVDLFYKNVWTHDHGTFSPVKISLGVYLGSAVRATAQRWHYGRFSVI